MLPTQHHREKNVGWQLNFGCHSADFPWLNLGSKSPISGFFRVVSCCLLKKWAVPRARRTWLTSPGPAGPVQPFGYQKPMYDQCDQYAPARPLCQGPSYMQQPYGNGIGYQQPLPGYGDYAQPAVLPQQKCLCILWKRL